MSAPFPLLKVKGVFSGAEGEGVVRIPSDLSWAELATSSLEGLDICYVHIT